MKQTLANSTDFRSILHVIDDRARITPNRIAFSEFGSDEQLTYRQFVEKATFYRNELFKLGIKSGDVVAVIAMPGIPTEVIDKAILAAGGVVMGIDPGITLVELMKSVEKVSVSAFVLSQKDIVANAPVQEFIQNYSIHLDMSQRPYKSNSISGETQLMASEMSPEDPAVILQTSGTTGDSQFVRLNHDQVAASLFDVADHFNFAHRDSESDRLISWLPPFNATSRLIHSLSYLYGNPIVFLSDPQKIVEAMVQVQPTAFFGPPRIFEKVYENVIAKLGAVPLIGPFLSGAFQKEQSFFWRWLAVRLVQPTLQKNVFGRSMQHLFSGSAPMRKDVARFFESLNLPIVECYGMTEIASLISIQTEKSRKMGATGQLLAVNEYRVADNGELLVKGKTVFDSYLGQDSVPSSFTDEGFYKSGDLVEIQGDHVFVKGRVNEVFKTSTGLKVSPVQVEQHFSALPEVENLVVFGKSEKYLGALIFATQEARESYKKRHGERFLEVLENDLIQKIENENKRLPKNMRLAKIRAVDDSLTVDAGLLTKSLKLRRSQVQDRYNEQVKDLFKVS